MDERNSFALSLANVQLPSIFMLIEAQGNIYYPLSNSIIHFFFLLRGKTIDDCTQAAFINFIILINMQSTYILLHVYTFLPAPLDTKTYITFNQESKICTLTFLLTFIIKL